MQWVSYHGCRSSTGRNVQRERRGVGKEGRWHGVKESVCTKVRYASASEKRGKNPG